MTKHILNLSIGSLTESPYQGRFFDKVALKNIYTKKQLDELAASIESTGLMQPITVRMTGDNYEIIDGHRRVEAFKQLGKGNIPAIVTEGTEQEVQVMSLVANIQRSNLSNLERAMAFEKILANAVFSNKKELSVAIGKDETYVGDILNLLKMDARIVKDLAENRSISDVRMLRIIRNAHKTGSDGISDKQYELYHKVLRENLSRSQLAALIKQEKEKGNLDKAAFSINYGNNGFYVKFGKKLAAGKKAEVTQLLEMKINEILDEMGL